MDKHPFSPATFALIASMLFSTQSIAAPEYDVVDLSHPLDTFSVALDVNQFNEATGIAGVHSPDGTRQLRTAFVYRNGATEHLSPALEGKECLGLGINDSGIVAGCTYLSDIDMVEFDRVYSACYWEDNEIHELGTFGGYRALLRDVNNQGQFVGYFSVQTEDEYYDVPFVYSNGICSPLNIPNTIVGHESALHWKTVSFEPVPFSDYPSTWTRIGHISINDAGFIVASFLSSERSNFSILWTADSIVPLSLDGSDTLFLATGLTEDLRILGDATPLAEVESVKSLPAFWEDGKLRIFPSLTVGYNNRIYGSHPGGFMVGLSDSSGARPHTAGVYWRNDSTQMLDSLIESSEEWTIASAYDLNDSGVIVGAGRKMGGKLRAVMLVRRKDRVDFAKIDNPQSVPNGLRARSFDSRTMRLYGLTGRQIPSGKLNGFGVSSAASGTCISVRGEGRQREAKKLLLR